MQLAERAEAAVGSLGARLFAWRRAIWRRARRSRSGGRKEEWRITVEQVIADLETLNRNTEQDFLQIGGKLAEFIEAVNLISSELTTLTNLFLAEQGRHGTALRCALDGSLKMRARHAERSAALAGIRHDAVSLKTILSELDMIISTFHTLGVLTRVETALLGSHGSDFGSLAEDMKALAGSVEARVGSARDAAARLTPSVENAMQEIAAIEEGQAKDLPSVVARLEANLCSFRDIQHEVYAASDRLGVRYKAISDAFKKLIMSVQFHDITRQQVEHVIEALRHLCSDGGGGGGGQFNIGAILMLQSSQLADAGAKFASSVASATHSLDEVAVLVREMVEESRTLTGQTEDEKNLFFGELEAGCAIILSALTRCAKAEAATLLTSASLTKTIAEMSESTVQIQAIEIQIHRMALNGNIRAAHIGTSGAGLSVLAASMQQLSREAKRLSESLVGALGSMSKTAVGLFDQNGPDSRDTCLGEIEAAAVQLHSSSERCFTQASEIIAHGARLGEELSTTRDGFSVGPLFAEAVAQARKMLGGIEAQNQVDSRSASGEELNTDLAALARHYTMQAERDVHESIYKTTPAASRADEKANVPELAAQESGETGDNIEFF